MPTTTSERFLRHAAVSAADIKLNPLAAPEEVAVVKALALGASGVMIGRPVLHGLAAAGATGVAHVLKILRTELEIAMALTGRPTLGDVDRSVLW